MIPGEFTAHDEQVAAMVGQPTHVTPTRLMEPAPPYVQPISCRCTRVREQPFGMSERRPPCVEQAGPDGLCPACAKGLCTSTAIERETAA